MGIYRSRVLDLLTISVGISRPRIDRKQGRTASRQRLVTLVLDSGSRFCSLTPDVIRNLDLPHLREV